MIKELLIHQVFVSVAIALVVCELWKFIDFSVRKKKLDWSALFETGGMPSSHSTFVCAIATSIGLVEGFASTIFLLSAGFAIVVVRDAFGVRRDVDKLTGTVNKIIHDKKVGIQEILKITGHTPVQVVVGSTLGIVVPLLMLLFYT
ncbi:divergent PAP2 family protein [Candidatus Woesearchaeota archaeon]|nr:divergent PAP2 family protein [Candidatus Woesearchaeota archaeon]